MTFRVYPIYIIVPTIFTVIFFLVIAWIIFSAGRQVQTGVAKPHLGLRLLVSLLLPSVFFVFFGFDALYMMSKRIDVSNQTLTYTTLLDHKQVAWQDVSQVSANFTLTSRLGFFAGRGAYAWMDLIKQNGEIVHLSLRFLENTNQLQYFVRQKFPIH